MLIVDSMFGVGTMMQEDGWVDPFSFEELWLPSDLPAPVMKPSLAAVSKNGQLRYIMPALDLTVQAAGKLWWNRGFNSIPLAGEGYLYLLQMVQVVWGGYVCA